MQTAEKKNDSGAPLRVKRPTSLNDGPGDNPENSAFRTKPLKEAIESGKEQPPLATLFPELLLETELNIFFGPTGKGKSIFGTQIADHVARDHPDKNILILDCELSERNLAKRYPDYDAPPNLYRAEINPDYLDFSDAAAYNDRIIRDLELEQQRIDAWVIIIDNISYLRDDTERARDASPLMKSLKNLQKKRDITILVLAHTPKRDDTRPLSGNDLMGSSRLFHFVDQLFAIGVSRKDPGLRYIKQIKSRNADRVYHEDNVLILEKTEDDGWLHFNIVGYGTEEEHLADPTAAEKSDRDEMILSFRRAHPNMSLRKIADECDCSKSAVERTLKKYKQAQEGDRK